MFQSSGGTLWLTLGQSRTATSRQFSKSRQASIVAFLAARRAASLASAVVSSHSFFYSSYYSQIKIMSIFRHYYLQFSWVFALLHLFSWQFVGGLCWCEGGLKLFQTIKSFCICFSNKIERKIQLSDGALPIYFLLWLLSWKAKDVQITYLQRNCVVWWLIINYSTTSK